MEPSLPVAERPRRPEWMKVRAPSADSRYFDVKQADPRREPAHDLRGGPLPEHRRVLGPRARRPSRSSATRARARAATATSHSGKPEQPPDPLEPLRLAQTAAQMGLKHVVVTSVDRDDVPDRGAGHYAATIRALKRKLPDATVEVLTPDFLGVEEEALGPCSPRGPTSSTTTSRPSAACMRGCAARRRATTRRSGSSQRAKELADYPVLTKSGIIVGLGETNDEVVETMRDLRAHGVDVVTIGQYLQPCPKHARDRPLGAPRRVPLVPRAGRGARLRLGLLGPARPLELPRRRAAPRRRDRPRRRSLLTWVSGRRSAPGGARTTSRTRPKPCATTARPSGTSRRRTTRGARTTST